MCSQPEFQLFSKTKGNSVEFDEKQKINFPLIFGGFAPSEEKVQKRFHTPSKKAEKIIHSPACTQLRVAASMLRRLAAMDMNGWITVSRATVPAVGDAIVECAE